jgi:integrase
LPSKNSNLHIKHNPPIFPVLLSLKQKGLKDTTVIPYNETLKHLDRNTDMTNPEEVVSFIMNKDVKNSAKNKYITVYLHFLNYYKIEPNFSIRHLKEEDQAIRIPTTEELNTLINSARYPLSLKLRISKETGMRPTEVMQLCVKDFDQSRKTLRPKTAKYGLSRILKISTELTNLISNHITKNNLNPEDYIFTKEPNKRFGRSYSEAFIISRNRTARKLGKPILKTIRLYDFRHYFATMLYARTRDILFVKQQMGHKHIEQTMRYTQYIQFENEENYFCKTATDPKQISELIEHGFEYVTEQDGQKFFRKRK